MDDDFEPEHPVEVVELLGGEGVEGLRRYAGVILQQGLLVALKGLDSLLGGFVGPPAPSRLLRFLRCSSMGLQ